MSRRIEARWTDGTLRAPKIGRFTASVAAGNVVVAGQALGTLQVLNARYAVVAPAAAAGRVATLDASRPGTPVGYDAPLMTLSAEGVDVGPAATGSGRELASDETVITAQMDGQFYRRPSPDEPQFVSAGDTLSPGQTFGLIEVMKFFYPVVFEGDAPVEVVAWVAEDGAPVEAGADLLIVR